MISKGESLLASNIATQLVDDGMIWGEELEWFIRTSVVGLIEFKSEEHYIEFEDIIIDFVENRRKIIRVLDICTKNVLFFDKPKNVADYLGISNATVSSALSKGVLMKRKYRVQYIKKSIKELSVC